MDLEHSSSGRTTGTGDLVTKQQFPQPNCFMVIRFEMTVSPVTSPEDKLFLFEEIHPYGDRNTFWSKLGADKYPHDKECLSNDTINL